jgi:polar amino acid transport system substrate-binding protein
MNRLLGLAFAVALAGVPLQMMPVMSQDAGVAAACTPEKSPKIKEIKDRGVLRWALGIAAPFGAKDANNAYVGADPESARELADILGVELELKDYSYNLLPPTVATGIADIAGTLYITDERRKVLDFSKPWQQDGQLFVVLDKSAELTSLDALNKPEVRVITRIGSGQVDLANKMLPKAQIITAEVIPGGEAQYLITGQADATIVDAVSAPLLVKAAGSVPIRMIGTRGAITGEVADADLIEPFDNGFGVAKGDQGFIDCLNAWVDDGVAAGRFHARFVKWVEALTK